MQNDTSEVPQSGADGLAPERIAAALAGLRPEPEAFARGVRERLAIAAATPHAAATEPRRRTSFSPSGPDVHPWVRRAAGLLPPGALEVILVGRGTGQSLANAGASFAPSMQAAIAAPWLMAMLGLALLAAMFRLGGRPAAGSRPPGGGLSPRRRLGLLHNLIGFALVVPAAALVFTVGVEVAVFALLATLAALVIFAAQTLRWLGAGVPVGLASALSSLLIQSALLVQIFAQYPSGVEFGPFSVLVLGLLLTVGGVTLALRVPRQERRRSLAFALSMLAVMGAWTGAMHLIHGPHAPHSVDALVAQAEAFEAPPDDLHAWRNFGRLAQVLPPERVAKLDLSRAAERLLEGTQLHPVTGLGAFQMGLLDPESVSFFESNARGLERDLARAEWRHAVPGYFPPERVLAAAIALERAPDPAEFGRRLAAWVDSNWPEPGTFASLRHTLLAAETIDLIAAVEPQAAEAVLEARRPTIEATLLAAWTGRDVAPTLGLGFESNLRERPHLSGEGFSERRRARIRSDLESTYAAVQLMARVGVPAGIDTHALHRYLTASSRRGVGTTWLPDQLAAGMARAVLEQRIGLEPLPLRKRAEREMPFLIGLMVVLLAHLCVPFRRPSDSMQT